MMKKEEAKMVELDGLICWRMVAGWFIHA